jgi:NAD(P)-dependent dehydrogenase (short-subunit alcohol dehydrogenase family)
MTNRSNKAIWLVGASSGIGEALADILATSSAKVFISARNAEKLDKQCAKALGRLIPVPMDVTDDWSVNEAVQKIAAHTESLDQVIINAGICEYIDSDEIDIQLVRQVMDTNFFGALNVLNDSLPLLRNALAKNGRDHAPQIVFVSSSVTYQALPRAGAYGASKAALRYFAESLKIDLQLEGIDVRVVSPGFVKTPLTDKNDFPMPFRISAEAAARRILEGLESKRFDIAFPKKFTWCLKLISKLPDRLRFKLLGKSSRHSVVPDKLNKTNEYKAMTNER